VGDDMDMKSTEPPADPGPAMSQGQGEAEGEGETLEAAVKGVAAGIAGKLKQVAGQLLDDEQLEQQGLRQQEEAEARRAGGEA
jgi:uncharacterized protein YjbJ (UPF0337 family)